MAGAGERVTRAVPAGPAASATSAALTDGTLRGWPRSLVRAVVLLLVRLVLSLRVSGYEHVPSSGAFLLVANHLHNADPVLIQAVLTRPVHFMAKEELFRVPVVAQIVRLVGSFPVNRQRPGRAAIRQAQLLLHHGVPVGMFPEGTRSKSGQLAPAYAGAGAIAIAAGCPILPVAIVGTEQLPGGAGSEYQRADSRRRLRPRVVIRFGEPFELPSAVLDSPRASAAATALMMARIASLLPAAYHGVYGETGTDQDGPAGASSSPRASAR